MTRTWRTPLGRPDVRTVHGNGATNGLKVAQPVRCVPLLTLGFVLTLALREVVLGRGDGGPRRGRGRRRQTPAPKGAERGA